MKLTTKMTQSHSSLALVPLLYLTLPVVASDCDHYGKLRYGYSYTFNHYYDARGMSRTHYIRNFNVGYSEQHDYNKSTSFPDFGWANSWENKPYIYPGEHVKIITANSKYKIKAVPPKRSRTNLTIRYTISDSQWLDKSQKWSDPVSHEDCKDYEITWCGDGIIDTEYNEECDPGDEHSTAACNYFCKEEEKGPSSIK